MPYCPTHGLKEGRFCPDCGGELLAAPPAGDTLRIRSPEQIVNVHTVPGAPAPPVRVRCIECGKKPLEAETFDCMGPCGRANLCLQHFDEDYSVCLKCAATLRGTAAQEAAGQARLEAEVKVKAEALAKVQVEVAAKTAALARAEAEVKTKVEALTRAEAALAEWRPRAERAEAGLAQATQARDAAGKELAQAQAKLHAAQTAATAAAADWLAQRTALEKAVAEWRGRAERAEAQLAEIAAKAKAEVEAKAEAARRAAEAAKQQPIGQRLGIEWVKIPAGEFLYGENKQKVSLPEYRMAKTPVTNAQYKAFVDATGHRPPSHWQGGQIPKGKENHPVVNVDWNDAGKFCQWAGLRLPSEQEWEKAARGTDGREYPWGAAAPTDKLCNFNSNVNDTTPVGRYSPAGDSPYGCADMAGNVWEWCADLYQSDQSTRVLRGGSFDSVAQDVRCAFRDRYSPENRDDYVGFRVVSPGL